MREVKNLLLFLWCDLFLTNKSFSWKQNLRSNNYTIKNNSLFFICYEIWHRKYEYAEILLNCGLILEKSRKPLHFFFEKLNFNPINIFFVQFLVETYFCTNNNYYYFFNDLISLIYRLPYLRYPSRFKLGVKISSKLSVIRSLPLYPLSFSRQPGNKFHLAFRESIPSMIFESKLLKTINSNFPHLPCARVYVL